MKMGQQRFLCQIIPEIPGIQSGYRNSHALLHIIDIYPAHIKRLVADDFCRTETIQLVQQFSFTVHFRYKEISGCNVGRRNAVFIPDIYDTHEIIVFCLV